MIRMALILTLTFGGAPGRDVWRALEVTSQECEEQRERVLREALTHSILAPDGVSFSAKCVMMNQ